MCTVHAIEAVVQGASAHLVCAEGHAAAAHIPDASVLIIAARDHQSLTVWAWCHAAHTSLMLSLVCKDHRVCAAQIPRLESAVIATCVEHVLLHGGDTHEL